MFESRRSELRIEGDLDPGKRLRHRTARLCGIGVLNESRIIDAGNLGFAYEMAAGDPELPILR